MGSSCSTGSGSKDSIKPHSPSKQSKNTSTPSNSPTSHNNVVVDVKKTATSTFATSMISGPDIGDTGELPQLQLDLPKHLFAPVETDNKTDEREERKNPPVLAHLKSVPTDEQKLLFGFTNIKADLKPKLVKIYHAACYSDSRLERNALYEKVYPELRRQCAEKGFDLEVVDLHMGTAEFSDGHTFKDVCLSQIDDTSSKSVASGIVLFLNEKSGVQAPRQVPASDFEEIIGTLESQEDKDLLNQWYTKDENTKDSLYILAKISSHINNFSEYNLDTIQQWSEINEKIVDIFQSKLSKVKQKMHLTSALDEEVQHCIFSFDAKPEQVICFNRVFDDFIPDIADPATKDYIDVTCNQENKSIHTRTLDSKNKIKPKIEFSNYAEFNVKWIEGGLDPERHREHKSYLEEFCEKYENVLKLEIRRSIESAVEKEMIHLKPKLMQRMCDMLTRQAKMCQTLCKQFQGQNELLSKLQSYVEKGSEVNTPFLLAGQTGSGKSTMAAMLADTCHTVTGWDKCAVVLRFINLSPETATMEQVARSICEQLYRLAGLSISKASKSLEEHKRTLPSLLSKASSFVPILIILDGLDQVRDYGSDSINWIPSELPENVRLVITLESSSNMLASLKNHLGKNLQEENVPNLSSAASVEILDRALKLKKRKLVPEQRKLIDIFQEGGNPLHATMLANMACKLNSFMPLDEINVKNNVKEQVVCFFDDLEQQYGVEAIGVLIGYLTAAKFGLSGIEIRDLLSCDLLIQTMYSDEGQGHAPELLWAQVRNEILPYLHDRPVDNKCLYTWKYAIFNQVAHQRYLSDDSKLSSIHSAMLDYFTGKNSNDNQMILPQEIKISHNLYNTRRLELEPYHAFYTNQASYADKYMFNIDWLHDKLKACDTYSVLEDFKLELSRNPDNADLKCLYDIIQVSAHALNSDGAQLLSQVYTRTMNNKVSDYPRIKALVNMALKPPLPILLPTRYCLTPTDTDQPFLTGLYRVKGDKNHMVSLHESTQELKVWGVANEDVVRTLTGVTAPRDFCAIDTHTVCILCNRELVVYNIDEGTFMSKLKGVLNVKMPYYGMHNMDHVVSLSRNRMYVNIMNIHTGDMAATFKVGEDRFLNSLNVSGNGQFCVCGDETQKPFPLLVWNLNDRKLIHDIRIPQHEFLTQMCGITADGHFVVCVAKELDDLSPNFIVVYDLTTGQLFKKWKPECDTTCVAIHGKANFIVNAVKNGDVMVWDMVSGVCLHHMLGGHSGGPDKIFLSDNGLRAVTYDSTGADMSVHLWDLEKGVSLGAFTSDDTVTACQITADGSKVVIAIPGNENIIVLESFTQDGPLRTTIEETVFGDASRKGLVFDTTENQ
ncbi:unnamed protein product [Owenia fusiformis]|uniref:NACHT domain-containing protein n=1 Tax=Owenia fusiformis TaxID=6347 RepID=A0A8J1Y8K1_OWEFU|nr:unnamed protein product [Owenia fusiformis]CAH1780312.1 unnamed protein product [Owenia fusiformis]